MTGTVLVLPGTRGSAGGSGTLAECLRLGTGPAAILLPSASRTIVVGVLVADELYGRPTPVLVVPGDAHAPFRTGEFVTIATGGGSPDPDVIPPRCTRTGATPEFINLDGSRVHVRMSRNRTKFVVAAASRIVIRSRSDNVRRWLACTRPL